MAVQEVTMNVDVPDGYYAVEVAIAKVGDLVVRSGKVRSNQCEHCLSPELILKSLKWRTGLGGNYFFLCTGLRPSMGCDGRGQTSDVHYHAGNYFQTIEEAGLASIKIKALLAQ
tara:strand:+ start:46 stop:387 length:342 start_codon:yes stop_codon:yes gene_type:complete